MEEVVLKSLRKLWEIERAYKKEITEKLEAMTGLKFSYLPFYCLKLIDKRNNLGIWENYEKEYKKLVEELKW